MHVGQRTLNAQRATFWRDLKDSYDSIFENRAVLFFREPKLHVRR
jgi:hypothetical protein